MKFVICVLAVLGYASAFDCFQGTNVAAQADFPASATACDETNGVPTTCTMPKVMTSAAATFMDYGCGACANDAVCETCDTAGCNTYSPTLTWNCWMTSGAGTTADPTVYASTACFGAEEKCWKLTSDEDVVTAGCGMGDKANNDDIMVTDGALSNSVESYKCYEYTVNADDATKMDAGEVTCEDQAQTQCFGPNPENADTVTPDADTKKGGCGACATGSGTVGCATCTGAKCNSALKFVPFLSILLVVAFWLH